MFLTALLPIFRKIIPKTIEINKKMLYNNIEYIRLSVYVPIKNRRDRNVRLQ